jgi:hypothetical protein
MTTQTKNILDDSAHFNRPIGTISDNGNAERMKEAEKRIQSLFGLSDQLKMGKSVLADTRGRELSKPQSPVSESFMKL